jgi:hypothetical protein
MLRRVLAFQPDHSTAQAALALALSRLGLDRDAAP